MMKKLLTYLLTLTFCLLSLSIQIQAQAPRSMNAAEIKLALNKLGKLCSILYVGAHPDDENTAVLAYLANETQCRTAYLSLTRGEGGQNLIGSEKGAALGVIRTQELLAARRIDGAEQFFTRAVDFGFSKTSRETFEKWNKQEVLSDVVWTIRKFRPDLIITRFPPDPRAGHGHHQASAILAAEAFKLAGDDKAFPEQLKYVAAWQPKRLLWNAFVRKGDAAPPDAITVDVGKFNPLLGKSYTEIAAESRTMHKSQGMGTAAQRGSRTEYFTFVDGEKANKDLLDGVETSWKRIEGGEAIGKLIDEANAKFNFENPSSVASILYRAENEIGRKVLQKFSPNETNAADKQKLLATSDLLLPKFRDVKRIVPSVSGVFSEALSSEPVVTKDSDVRIKTSFINLGRLTINNLVGGITVIANSPNKKPSVVSSEILPNKFVELQSAVNNPYDFSYSEPYWLNREKQTAQQDRTYAENGKGFFSDYDFTVNGEKTIYGDVVQYKYVDRVRGEVYQPLVVAPNLTANLSENLLVFADDQPKTIRVNLKAFASTVKGKIFVKLSEGYSVEQSGLPVDLKKGEEISLTFRVTSSIRATIGNFELGFQDEKSSTTEPLKQFQTIDYQHIPRQVLFPDATAKLVKLDLQTSKTRVGYIVGSGDDVPDALKQVGFDVKTISDADFETLDLGKEFDTIVVGIRAYNVRDVLKRNNKKLLDFANNGGKVVVQYVTPDETLLKNFAPFPLKIGGNQKTLDRVTDENSPIRFLDVNARILNYPNKITQADFKDWVQERGLYFASEYDKNFTPVLVMNDPNEPEQTGSLLIAKTGKGEFVYTGLSFFRELPAGVPGAYRLFVNVISK